MICIGTSGFSYQDWKGGFYPAGLPQREMLAYYARHFSACEINATYYRIPTAANMEAMVAKSGGRVRFVVKAHQAMTHARAAGAAEYAAFAGCLAPLREAGVLGGVLAQFPFSFSNHLENRGYVVDLKKALGRDAPLIVEFRHQSWNRPETFEFLRAQEIAAVNVDEPALHGLLPATEEATSPVGYVRFHGRNREKWFQKGGQPWERYDYLYSQAELSEWVPRIERLSVKTEVTYVFFNNHWKSQAVTNARQMRDLLHLPAPDAGGGTGAEMRLGDDQGNLFVL